MRYGTRQHTLQHRPQSFCIALNPTPRRVVDCPGGDKVEQTDDDQSFTFFQNGQYTMATSAMTQTGKYRFDQAAKKITMTSEDTGMESGFTVTTLTDDRLTLTAPDGSAIKLKAE